VSTTPALRALRAAGVAFEEHQYRYEDRGGTRVSARQLGVDEHGVVKTLVLQDDAGRLLLVLMHGDREVSLKALARPPASSASSRRRRRRRSARPATSSVARRRSARVSRCRRMSSVASWHCPASTSTGARVASS
jgi:prolyl-tRNA editing enzyme YbaK/EbsC (Cys-tRNA(Pro) deacylase)